MQINMYSNRFTQIRTHSLILTHVRTDSQIFILIPTGSSVRIYTDSYTFTVSNISIILVFFWPPLSNRPNPPSHVLWRDVAYTTKRSNELSIVHGVDIKLSVSVISRILTLIIVCSALETHNTWRLQWINSATPFGWFSTDYSNLEEIPFSPIKLESFL